MNREHKIFLGWGTVFKRAIRLKEQRKECWIVRGAKTINREYKNLFGVCGGEEAGNQDSKCALFDPSACIVPFLIIQRALEMPLFIKLPCPFLFLA